MHADGYAGFNDLSIGRSGAGSTSFPSRASLRHSKRWLALNPCHAVTSRTLAPASSVYATTRAFSSSDQRRYRRRPPRPIVRNSIEVDMEELPFRLQLNEPIRDRDR